MVFLRKKRIEEEYKMRKTLISITSAFMIVIMAFTVIPFVPKAAAASAPTQADYFELEKILASFIYTDFTDLPNFFKGDPNDYTEAYRGKVFSRNNAQNTRLVLNEIFKNLVYVQNSIYEKYFGKVKVINGYDPLSVFCYDEYSGYHKAFFVRLPANNVNTILKNVFNLTPYLFDEGSDWYYYDGYYYVSCFRFEDYFAYSADILDKKINQNGTYSVNYSLQRIVNNKTEIGRFNVNVSLSTVGGKKQWRINSIKRIISICDAYEKKLNAFSQWVYENYDARKSDYNLYDIEKDGVPELLVTKKASGKTQLYIYTYQNGSAVNLKSFDITGSSLYGNDGKNGFYKVSVKNGYRIASKITKEKNAIKIQSLNSSAAKNINTKSKIGFTSSGELGYLPSKCYPIPSNIKTVKATQTTTSIKLSWPSALSAKAYRIYRYDAKSKRYVKITDTSKSSYTINNLTSGTEYKFAVRPYNKQFGTLYAAKSATYLITAAKPGTPTLKAASGVSSVTLSWTRQSGATGYVLYRSASQNGSYSKVATIKGNSVTKYTVKNLSSGKTYYFKIAAYKTSGGQNVFGSFSSVKNATVK